MNPAPEMSAALRSLFPEESECHNCDGKKVEADDDPTPCRTCAGEGILRVIREGTVEGARYQIGDDVTVIGLCDEVGNPLHVGKTGRVVALDYASAVGQRYPKDPMFCLVFSDGKKGEYWTEELARTGTPEAEKVALRTWEVDLPQVLEKVRARWPGCTLRWTRQNRENRDDLTNKVLGRYALRCLVVCRGADPFCKVRMREGKVRFVKLYNLEEILMEEGPPVTAIPTSAEP